MGVPLETVVASDSISGSVPRRSEFRDFQPILVCLGRVGNEDLEGFDLFILPRRGMEGMEDGDVIEAVEAVIEEREVRDGVLEVTVVSEIVGYSKERVFT